MRNTSSTHLFVLLCVALVLTPGQAKAVVLASDDFNAEGGGFGFDPADNWDNLSGGVSDTSVLSPAFRNFSAPITPFDTTSIFIAFDFNGLTPTSWGGVSLFEGQNGTGNETLFIGSPGGFDYGINTSGAGTVGTGIVIDDQVRSIVAEVEFTPTGDTYRIWVDNFNQALPSGELVLTSLVIEEDWQSVRVASDIGANQFVEVDNLVIATTAADVGLIPAVDAVMSVDRTTGGITLSTNSGSLANVVGYTLSSGAGGLDAAGWAPIDGRLDTPGGDGTFDDDDWLAATGTAGELSEQVVSPVPGDGGTVTNAGVDLGSAWNPSPFEDVTATLLVNDGGTIRPLVVDVVYSGTEIVSGDLDGDADIDAQDWALFKSGQGIVNNTMSQVEAYQLGDLDGNFDHNLTDFDLFAEAFDLANGGGSFAQLLAGVPEPTSLMLLTIATGIATGLSPRRTS